MSLNVYLTFDGNCREAFDFYKSVFGGDFAVCETFAAAPPDSGIAADDKDRIMHVSLPVGATSLMGSDTGQGFDGPLVVGTNFSISIVGESKPQSDALFARLSEGGEVDMPMQETFWGAYFGRCRDKFGIKWMVNCDLGHDAA